MRTEKSTEMETAGVKVKCKECRKKGIEQPMNVVAVIPGQGERLKIERCPKCGHEAEFY